MNQDLIKALEIEIEQLEVLSDDLSEFTKGCTDAEQSQLGYALDILGKYIAIAGEKLREAELDKDSLESERKDNSD